MKNVTVMYQQATPFGDKGRVVAIILSPYKKSIPGTLFKFK